MLLRWRVQSVCRFCIAEEHFSSDFTLTFFSPMAYLSELFDFDVGGFKAPVLRVAERQQLYWSRSADTNLQSPTERGEGMELSSAAVGRKRDDRGLLRCE
jgi:hypothetical protein